MPHIGRARQRKSKQLKLLSLLLLLSGETLVPLFVARKAQKLLQHIPRGPYTAVHSEDFIHVLLNNSSEKRFKAFLRTSKASFDHLVDLIKDDEVFISTGRKPQRPPWYQLAVFLLRFGGATALRTAGESSIAEGTVYLYCSRVARVFRKLRPQFLSWPDQNKRQVLKERMLDYGFPGCIGMVDGSLIPLAVKPLKDGETYFCRKKYYAIIVQAVCDDTSRFTEYDLGWPGSVQDTTVFRESGVWRHRGEHFEHDEYILADKGYPLTKFTIRPFNDSDLTNNAAEVKRRQDFNFSLSSLRIKIEHAFGMLKGRFPALRNMPGTDMDMIYMAVEALMVIHNILIDLNDDPTEIENYIGIDELGLFGEIRQGEDQGVERQITEINKLEDTVLYRTGLYRRKQLMRYMGL